MPRNDPSDLRPPIPYKVRHVPRPLTKGEIKAAADRAEARAMLTQLTDDPAADSGARNPGASSMLV
jgi:hypothetical protein